MFNLNYFQPRKAIFFICIYIFGISILLFTGEYYIEYLLGCGLSLMAFSYFTYYLSNNNLENQHLKNIYFLSLLFFWLRLPFIMKPIICMDFKFNYNAALMILRDQNLFVASRVGCGPVFSLFLYIPTVLTNGDYFALKFFFIFIDYLNFLLIYLITRQLKFKYNYKIQILYATMPFIIIQFAWEVHNDVGVVLLVLISVYLLLKGHHCFSSCFILLAVAYKFYAIFIYPIFIIYLYKIKKSDERFFIKFMKFNSPIFLFGGVIFLYSPNFLISLLKSLIQITLSYHGSRLPKHGLLTSLTNIAYGPNLYQIIGRLVEKSPSPLNNAFLFIPVLFGISYLISFKLTSKYSKSLLFLSNVLILIGFLMLPVINALIWLLLDGFIFLIILKNCEQIKRDDWVKYLFIYLSFSVLFIPFVLFTLENDITIYANILKIISMIVLIVFLLIIYYTYLKNQKNNENYLLLSIFYIIILFLLFFWVFFTWYLLWALPFALILFNKNKASNFFILFIQIYSIIIQDLRIVDFYGFSNIIINLLLNVPFQIGLIAILTVINVIICIKILKQNVLNGQISRFKILIIICLWSTIGILIFNIPLNTLINQISFDVDFLYYIRRYDFIQIFFILRMRHNIFNIFYYVTLFNFSNQLMYIFIIETIYSIFIIYFFVDKYFSKYLKINKEKSTNQDYLKYYNLITLEICLIFFINSIPLMQSNIFQISFNLLSIFMLLFFIIKGKDSNFFLPKDFESSSNDTLGKDPFNKFN
ncbi:MAG: hypothetical protein ACFFDN_18325 [Candidatus Hodarchaeota archaeon]